MYNKTIIEFGFCENAKLSRSGQVLTLTSTLIIPHITKTSSNDCLFIRMVKDIMSSDCIYIYIGKQCPQLVA